MDNEGSYESARGARIQEYRLSTLPFNRRRLPFSLSSAPHPFAGFAKRYCISIWAFAQLSTRWLLYITPPSRALLGLSIIGIRLSPPPYSLCFARGFTKRYCITIVCEVTSVHHSSFPRSTRSFHRASAFSSAVLILLRRALLRRALLRRAHLCFAKSYCGLRFGRLN